MDPIKYVKWIYLHGDIPEPPTSIDEDSVFYQGEVKDRDHIDQLFPPENETDLEGTFTVFIIGFNQAGDQIPNQFDRILIKVEDKARPEIKILSDPEWGSSIKQVQPNETYKLKAQVMAGQDKISTFKWFLKKESESSVTELSPDQEFEWIVSLTDQGKYTITCHALDTAGDIVAQDTIKLEFLEGNKEAKIELNLDKEKYDPEGTINYTVKVKKDPNNEIKNIVLFVTEELDVKYKSYDSIKGKIKAPIAKIELSSNKIEDSWKIVDLPIGKYTIVAYAESETEAFIVKDSKEIRIGQPEVEIEILKPQSSEGYQELELNNQYNLKARAKVGADKIKEFVWYIAPNPGDVNKLKKLKDIHDIGGEREIGRSANKETIIWTADNLLPNEYVIVCEAIDNSNRPIATNYILAEMKLPEIEIIAPKPNAGIDLDKEAITKLECKVKKGESLISEYLWLTYPISEPRSQVIIENTKAKITAKRFNRGFGKDLSKGIKGILPGEWMLVMYPKDLNGNLFKDKDGHDIKAVQKIEFKSETAEYRVELHVNNEKYDPKKHDNEIHALDNSVKLDIKTFGGSGDEDIQWLSTEYPDAANNKDRPTLMVKGEDVMYNGQKIKDYVGPLPQNQPIRAKFMIIVKDKVTGDDGAEEITLTFNKEGVPGKPPEIVILEPKNQIPPYNSTKPIKFGIEGTNFELIQWVYPEGIVNPNEIKKTETTLVFANSSKIQKEIIKSGKKEVTLKAEVIDNTKANPKPEVIERKVQLSGLNAWLLVNGEEYSNRKQGKEEYPNNRLINITLQHNLENTPYVDQHIDIEWKSATYKGIADKNGKKEWEINANNILAKHRGELKTVREHLKTLTKKLKVTTEIEAVIKDKDTGEEKTLYAKVNFIVDPKVKRPQPQIRVVEPDNGTEIFSTRNPITYELIGVEPEDKFDWIRPDGTTKSNEVNRKRITIHYAQEYPELQQQIDVDGKDVKTIIRARIKADPEDKEIIVQKEITLANLDLMIRDKGAVPAIPEKKADTKIIFVDENGNPIAKPKSFNAKNHYYLKALKKNLPNKISLEWYSQEYPIDDSDKNKSMIKIEPLDFFDQTRSIGYNGGKINIQANFYDPETEKRFVEIEQLNYERATPFSIEIEKKYFVENEVEKWQLEAKILNPDLELDDFSIEWTGEELNSTIIPEHKDGLSERKIIVHKKEGIDEEIISELKVRVYNPITNQEENATTKISFTEEPPFNVGIEKEYIPITKRNLSEKWRLKANIIGSNKDPSEFNFKWISNKLGEEINIEGNGRQNQEAIFYKNKRYSEAIDEEITVQVEDKKNFRLEKNTTNIQFKEGINKIIEVEIEDELNKINEIIRYNEQVLETLKEKKKTWSKNEDFMKKEHSDNPLLQEVLIKINKTLEEGNTVFNIAISNTTNIISKGIELRERLASGKEIGELRKETFEVAGAEKEIRKEDLLGRIVELEERLNLQILQYRRDQTIEKTKIIPDEEIIRREIAERKQQAEAIGDLKERKEMIVSEHYNLENNVKKQEPENYLLVEKEIRKLGKYAKQFRDGKGKEKDVKNAENIYFNIIVNIEERKKIKERKQEILNLINGWEKDYKKYSQLKYTTSKNRTEREILMKETGVDSPAEIRRYDNFFEKGIKVLTQTIEAAIQYGNDIVINISKKAYDKETTDNLVKLRNKVEDYKKKIDNANAKYTQLSEETKTRALSGEDQLGEDTSFGPKTEKRRRRVSFNKTMEGYYAIQQRIKSLSPQLQEEVYDSREYAKLEKARESRDAERLKLAINAFNKKNRLAKKYQPNQKETIETEKDEISTLRADYKTLFDVSQNIKKISPSFHRAGLAPYLRAMLNSIELMSKAGITNEEVERLKASADIVKYNINAEIREKGTSVPLTFAQRQIERIANFLGRIERKEKETQIRAMEEGPIESVPDNKTWQAEIKKKVSYARRMAEQESEKERKKEASLLQPLKDRALSEGKEEILQEIEEYQIIAQKRRDEKLSAVNQMLNTAMTENKEEAESTLAAAEDSLLEIGELIDIAKEEIQRIKEKFREANFFSRTSKALKRAVGLEEEKKEAAIKSGITRRETLEEAQTKLRKERDMLESEITREIETNPVRRNYLEPIRAQIRDLNEQLEEIDRNVEQYGEEQGSEALKQKQDFIRKILEQAKSRLRIDISGKNLEIQRMLKDKEQALEGLKDKREAQDLKLQSLERIAQGLRENYPNQEEAIGKVFSELNNAASLLDEIKSRESRIKDITNQEILALQSGKEDARIEARKEISKERANIRGRMDTIDWLLNEIEEDSKKIKRKRTRSGKKLKTSPVKKPTKPRRPKKVKPKGPSPKSKKLTKIKKQRK